MSSFTLKLVMICVLFFSISESVSSQVLYGLQKSVNGSMTIPFDVVKIDPFTGTTSVEMTTNSLVGVAAGATAYDQQNKRYICWGFDTGNSQQLYVVELDDTTSSSVPFTTVQPIELEYDLQTQKTYGLWWDGSAEHFGEIDLVTGVATSIATLPGVDAVAIGNSTFDSNTETYIFIGIDGNDTKLYRVKASSGVIISSPTIWQNGDRYSALEFNVNNNKLYGLYQDLDSTNFSQNYFNFYTDLRLAEIDLTTGNFTIVNPQNTVIGGYLPGYAVGGLCFDQQSETYIVYVVNENGTFLKLVDVLTGNLVASTPLSNNDYFYEIQVDNYLFARTFYDLTTSESVKSNLLDATVYPNPTTDYLTIETSETLEYLLIYNSNGQVMKQTEVVNNNQIFVDDLRKGNYYIVAKTENGYVREQFVKQ